MRSDRLPIGWLRALCAQPIAEAKRLLLGSTDCLGCADARSPLVVVLVPGLAQSGEMDMLVPLFQGIRRGLMGAAGSITIVPGLWSIEEDIASYAPKLR